MNRNVNVGDDVGFFFYIIYSLIFHFQPPFYPHNRQVFSQAYFSHHPLTFLSAACRSVHLPRLFLRGQHNGEPSEGTDDILGLSCVVGRWSSCDVGSSKNAGPNLIQIRFLLKSYLRAIWFCLDWATILTPQCLQSHPQKLCIFLFV